MRRSVAALLGLLVLLAGCSDDDDGEPAPPTEEECAAQGQSLYEDNGTVSCGPLRPPAVVALVGVPAVAQAYDRVAFNWTLETHKEQNHAMLTEVRVATASVPASALAGPDSFGESVAKQEHQDFESGRSYAGGFRPVVSGAYYLRAYALVEGKDLWSEEQVLQVNEVVATETVHDVTLPAGSAAQGPSPAELTIALGDSVAFVNDDVLPRTIAFTGPAQIPDVSLQPLSASTPVLFTVPGEYSYTSGEAAGAVSGSISVPLP